MEAPTKSLDKRDLDPEPGDPAQHRCCVLTVSAVELESLALLEMRRYGLLGELATSVDDSSKATRHDVEDAGDTGKEEDGRQRQLDGVGRVPDVQCRTKHVEFARRHLRPFREE